MQLQDNTLPKGIWYETERNRYRVRLYARGRIAFRDYFDTLTEALDAHRNAQAKQTAMKANQRRQRGSSFSAALQALWDDRPQMAR